MTGSQCVACVCSSRIHIRSPATPTCQCRLPSAVVGSGLRSVGVVGDTVVRVPRGQPGSPPSCGPTPRQVVSDDGCPCRAVIPPGVGGLPGFPQ